MILDTELATYQRHRPQLLAEEGRFVVIGGEKLLGTFESYDDALSAGYDRCGLTPFLVKRIEQTETVYVVNRDIGPSCPI